jgi:hypothetical protein
MLGFKVSQATVSRYLATVHRSSGQSWRTFIRNQALAFRYRDDLEYPNQDRQSRPDCSYRANLTCSARQIAKPGTGSRWLSQPRGIAAPPRLCARSASLRTFRYSTAPGRSSTAGANPVSVSVRMRGPPRHTTRFLKAGGLPVCRPSFEKGQGPEKAAHRARPDQHRKQSFVRGCRLSMLSAINAGNTGSNRPHQAGISTAGRYAFAGRVIAGRH